jgi:predicted transcriptional regulator
MNATLTPELLSRLERLAVVRHVDRDDLISEAIRLYLDREETEHESSPSRSLVAGTPREIDEGKIVVAPDFNAPLPRRYWRRVFVVPGK